MSEPVTAVVEPVVDPAIEPEPTPQGEPADKPLGANGEKALKAERARAETAEKNFKDATAKLKAAEDAKLGDLERAQKEASEAQVALADLTKQNIRNTVALTKQVPAALVKYLIGDTEAEISASADEILAQFNVPTTPRPDLTQATLRDAAAASGPEADFAQFLKSQIG